MNDDLIERMRRTLVGVPRFPGEDTNDWARRQAELLLPVFEEAHHSTSVNISDAHSPSVMTNDAPTDDEREALREAVHSGLSAYEMHRENPEYGADLVTAVVDAVEIDGFRRAVSPEPITEEQINAERARQIEKGYTPDHDRQHGIAHVLRYALHYGSRGEHLKAYAMVEAALEIAPPMFPNEPQGEPTDAQVLAALNAKGHAESKLYESAPDLEFFTAGSIYVMRAALRAAAETTKSENGSEEESNG